MCWFSFYEKMYRAALDLFTLTEYTIFVIFFLVDSPENSTKIKVIALRAH